MGPIELAWTNARGLKIYGQEWQPEGAPRGVVALVHGIGEHIGRYAHVAEAFNAAGFALIGFDLPGHGHSEGKRGDTSYDEVLEEIDHLLRYAGERYPDTPRFLYGHSLGGVIALYYALKRRPSLNGYISSAPGVFPGDPIPWTKILLGKVMAVIYPSFLLETGLDIRNLSRDPAVIQAYQNDPLVHSRVSARLGIDLISKGAWITSHAVDFPGPLLLVQGSQDHLVSPRDTRAFSEGVPADKLTFKTWDDLYHETHNEPEKAVVIQYIIDWMLGQIIPPSGGA